MADYDFSCKNGAILAFSDPHWGDRNYRYCGLRNSQFDEMMERYLPEFQHVVMNGDIIGTLLCDDFTHFKTHLDRIEQWTRRAPNTQFHYMLGNHDMTEGIVAALQERFPKGSNLHVADVWARCGDILFTHGDYGEANERQKDYASNTRLLLQDAEAETIRANYYSNPGRRGMTFSSVSSKSLGLDDRVQKACTPLDEHGLLEGISAVMVGHTHRTLYGYPFQTRAGDTVHVFNTGSLIAGASFMPLEVHMDEHGKVARSDEGRLTIRPVRGQMHLAQNSSEICP